MKKGKIIEIVFFILLFAFSWWLAWHTFYYHNGTFFISNHIWGDFADHIPLIRSFSMGNNWPPQSPLFPGQPIHYHYMLFLVEGFLETIGLRIDWAINIPGTLSMFFLLLGIYKLSLLIFKDKRVSFLSVFFFIFNGSLSFLEFFKKHPLSLNTLKDIVGSPFFPAIGPWDGSIVALFWNLDAYINQRHLVSALAISLWLLFFLLKIREGWSNKKKFAAIFIIGTGLGILSLTNLGIFATTALLLAWSFLIDSKLRRYIFFAGLFSLPWLILERATVGLSTNIKFNPGFLASSGLTPFTFVRFWVYNFGLHIILIPLGFILADTKTKKIFFPIFLIFIFANIFQFAPLMVDNHQFFNFFLVVGNMFSAFAIICIWKKIEIMTLPLIIILIFSGIIEIFPITNGAIFQVPDFPANPDAQFFKKNIPTKAVTLNSTFWYNPASIVGRRIFYGPPTYGWARGYDMEGREETAKQIYGASNRVEACRLLEKYNISYVELQNNHEAYIQPNLQLWNTQFYLIYQNPTSSLRIYDVARSCSSI
jgi:hypothetical protein